MQISNGYRMEWCPIQSVIIVLLIYHLLSIDLSICQFIICRFIINYTSTDLGKSDGSVHTCSKGPTCLIMSMTADWIGQSSVTNINHN